MENKYSLIAVWVSLVGSLILLISFLYSFRDLIPVILDDSWLVFWNKKSNLPIWEYFLAGIVWLGFPLLLLFLIYFDNRRQERKKLYLFSGISNGLLVLLPALAFLMIYLKTL